MSEGTTAPRRSPDVRRWTGIAAIAVAVLMITEFTVRMSMGDRPDLDQAEALGEFIQRTALQALLVIMIDLFLMTSMIVLLAGFRQIITHSRPDLQWVSDLCFGAGLVFVTITLIGDSMNGGAALDTVGMAPDPSAIRALTEGYTLMFGATGCVLIALICGAGGYVTLVSGALPRWTGWVAVVVAVTSVLVVPTMFNGTSTADPFSAGGDVVTIFATFPFFAWSVAVGVVTIRGRRTHEAVARQEVQPA